jgi:hypothetical protein
MINQFRKLTPVNVFLLLAYAFFMRMAIYNDLPNQLNYGFLEFFSRIQLSFSLENAISPAVNIFFATIIVFIQALIFNYVINSHNLMPRPTYLPALMYITGASLFMYFMILTPVLICNFLLIWLIDRFLKLGKSANCVTEVFDIGMIIAVGTILYFPFVALLLLVYLSLLLFRSFSWREWLAGLIGFLTVFFFLAVWYYWKDNLDAFYTMWKPLSNKFPVIFKINYKDYLVLIPVFAIIILASIQLQENFFRSYIITRKAFQMLFFMFIITALSFYLKADLRVWHFLLCVPAGAVLLAYFFVSAKKRWLYESLFLVLVLSIQYFLFV